MKLSRYLCATALIGAFAVLPGMASAQTETGALSAPPVADDAGEAVDVVVTGSRIRRPNEDSPIPITTITPQEILQTGRISIGDALNQLPQLRPSLGSQNSTSGLGTRGLNFLELRNLDRARTLTLVNGRRHVTADIINNGNAVDINTMPTDLIERIDIVTGGVSSVYGSDAIAGVVNFVLKNDYEGLQLRAQGGISDKADAGNQIVSILAGKNFADGRGNISINAEYAHQQDYYASGRRNLRRNDAFIVTDTDPASAPADSVFDRTFYRDIRSATIGLGGQLGFRYGNGAPGCGADSIGSAFTCGYLFQPDGSLVAQTGQRVGLGPNGNFVGGNGTTSREGNLLVLSPDTTRYVVNVLGHFEVSPAFVPFIEAKYVRTEAFGSQSGPFFSQGQTVGDGTPIAGFTDRSYSNAGSSNVNREGVRLDNPFLSAAARGTISQQLIAAINSGVNPNSGAAFRTANNTAEQAAANQAAALAQVAAGTYRFSSRRNWVDLGTRDERLQRDTFRAVVGVRGDFNDDWNYEVSANYGQHKENSVITGNVNTQRFLLALDSTRNAAGQIVCRSQVDAAYAGSDVGGNPTQLASDVAACVPLNPFGQGSVSEAARNYLVSPTTADGKATQFVVNGFVAGDLSQLFELPAGPVGFSVGGEYRRETLTYDLDPLTQAGYNFYNAIPSFRAPAFEVKEAYGELSIPLLKDVFLFKELRVTGAARVADYKGGAGTVYAWNGQAEWRPVQDLLLRGGYSRAVRAPYLGENYSPLGQNFTPAPSDPCSARNIGTGSATRAANCAAAGAPAGYDYVYTASLEIRSGGNPNLKAETSDSLTLGGVFQPSFLPGLSVSVDYYDIKVKDVITSPTVQQALDTCYDSPTLDNQFCALFQRAGAGGGPAGEVPFQILEASYQDVPQNYAQLRTRGVDTEIVYNRDFGFVRANLRGVWNHMFQLDRFNDPSRPNFKNVQTDELGLPSDRFNILTNLTFGAFRIGHTLRWIDSMYLNTWEDYNGVNGQPPQNLDYAPIQKYPTVTYNDINFNIEVSEKFDFYGGVNNVGDVNPPYGLTGIGLGSGIYDNRGRFFYAGLTARF
ncbi:TonB-dependent receptor [Sphingomonas sp. Leaf231]|uniref:TonB-dependent receptor domain-containing protein n=1 Tax=Sphingomonas sp. Leaf231 TaxID=1736301 RepID=UPI0006F68417|nr:TonB-dependent receptor [Sphingomonas sp. Leaf231]KQN89792.1 TonB-dependent receptor [Sphingomonas sp. Leaf231]